MPRARSQRSMPQPRRTLRMEPTMAPRDLRRCAAKRSAPKRSLLGPGTKLPPPASGMSAKGLRAPGFSFRDRSTKSRDLADYFFFKTICFGFRRDRSPSGQRSTPRPLLLRLSEMGAYPEPRAQFVEARI